MQGNEVAVAVVGSGYWGKNLTRVFHELGALRRVCDIRAESRQAVEDKYGVPTTDYFDSLLNESDVRAIAIATPAVQHYEMVRQALLHGKDVYVEKPLSLRPSEGYELSQLAEQRGLILMVGHILEYHPAISELKRLIADGELGKIQYIYSSRLNLGKLRTEENILWSFAPHDISAICSLLGELPTHVSSHGQSFLSPNVFDTTMTTCEFKSGVQAHIFVSWLHPFKEQKLAVIADRQMAVFDDVEPQRKLVLYSHRIDWRDRMPVAHKDEGHVVEIGKGEPLRLECEHFLKCVQDRTRPRTDGRSGSQVLEVLDACERSVRDNGRRVALSEVRPKYYSHATAVIDQPCKIGDGTKIWHFSHVMANSTIGKECNIGQNVVVSPGVIVGDHVKIQNNVSLYTGVELEDEVFCGPSMVFTNVINPRSHIVRRDEYKKTLVKRGATLGANSTIVCGTTIGEYAFIGAGAVVTHDVPPYALMLGVPARQVGYMCQCAGARLEFMDTSEEPGYRSGGLVMVGTSAATATCAACGANYVQSSTGEVRVELAPAA